LIQIGLDKIARLPLVFAGNHPQLFKNKRFVDLLVQNLSAQALAPAEKGDTSSGMGLRRAQPHRKAYFPPSQALNALSESKVKSCDGKKSSFSLPSPLTDSALTRWSVIGSRHLPASWASWDCFYPTAVGTDLYVLRSLVLRGAIACQGSLVFLPGDSSLVPSAGAPWLDRFASLGGQVVEGSASSSRPDYVAALLIRNCSIVRASAGVVAFVSGSSAGSWFTIHQAVRRGFPRRWSGIAPPIRLRPLGPLPFPGRGLSIPLFLE
jgi:hypothetical protein